MSQKDNEATGKAANDLLVKFVSLIQKEDANDSVIAGVLGALMGVITSRTDYNFPFVSFWGSFHKTYYANYSSKAPIYKSGPMQYENGKIRKVEVEDENNDN